MSASGRTGAIRPPTAELRASLERDLIEWADDIDLRLVWADLLQIDGDPLGRLVVLDYVGETNPAVRAEADALRESLSERLETPRDREFTLHWQLGFVQALEVRPRGGPKAVVRRIHDALRRPALRFLECLSVIIPDAEADPWPAAMLWSTTHSTLREVHVGDPPRLRQRPSGAYESGRGVRRYDYSMRGDILARFPRLRWVSVAGELARLACRDGSSETRKHHVDQLASRLLTSRNRTSLVRAIWDPSALVQAAAFATIGRLGPRAEFAVSDLELLLQPPVGDSDPRPTQAFTALAAIGKAGAGALVRLLASQEFAAMFGEARRANEVARCVGFLAWVRALGPAGRPALDYVDSLLTSQTAPGREIAASVRGAAKAARKAITAVGK